MSGISNVVERWCSFYTRGLPSEVAADRREELASDLFEHRSAGGSAAAIALRWISGIPSDLTWRHAVLRHSPTLVDRLPSRRLLTAARVLGGLMVAWGVVVMVRYATSTAQFFELSTFLFLAVATGIAAIGLLMFQRTRQRIVGSIALGLSALALNVLTLRVSLWISWVWSGRLERNVLVHLSQLSIPLALVAIYLPGLVMFGLFITAAVRSRPHRVRSN